MTRNYFLLLFLLLIGRACYTQPTNNPISVTEVERIERALSADEMQGRKVFTPGIEKAASFIADEFKAAGLSPLNSNLSLLQPFTMVRPRFISAKAKLDTSTVEESNIVAFTTKPLLNVTESSGYSIEKVSATDTFANKFRQLISSTKNVIVFVNPVHQGFFNNLKRFKRETFPKESSVVFVLTDKLPATFFIEVKHEFTELKLANVVGVLPGKSRKDEYVIFSGHFDHLGIGRPNQSGDSIYNGANDDAAGTTAVIMLAKYFAAKKNNERTIIFAAFTGEESGGFGSQYFSKQLPPEKVMAMFNIEMIGTESKWGTNSAYITGFDRSSMGTILQKNLEGSPFKFYPDPYIKEDLFYRSDNATLARLGVPAHTISTSKMDSEKYYHTQEDEIETLDLNNMAEIIRAIAVSSTSIISGKDSPTRVDTRQLR
jgi:hypothetical protein